LTICPSDSHPPGGFPVSDFGLGKAWSIEHGAWSKEKMWDSRIEGLRSGI